MGGSTILFVLNSLGAGGTERSVAELLSPLGAAGWRPIVAAFGHVDDGVEADVIAAGHDVRFVGGRLAARVAGLRRLAADERVAVVHTAIFDADLAGRLAMVRTGVPVLTSLINSAYDAARRSDPRVRAPVLEAYRRVDGWTARHLTAHFHAVTEGVKRAAVRDLGVDPDRVTVVHRGRDAVRLGRASTRRRADVRSRLGIAPDAEVVLTAGRQEYQKGHEHLVAAVDVLSRSRPRLVLLVAGRPGAATADLEVRAHGLGDRVRLLGFRDDVPDLLAAADVFALPSVYEGTAGVLIEAMALETPIVASDLDVLGDVVETDRTALLVPPRDPAALVAALARVLDDPRSAAAMASRARRVFEERFTLERSVASMIELYERLVPSPVPA